MTTTEVNDAEAFPPAYAWVFLFSQANQPFFAYRERGDRFEGYDWVRIFEFKGAVPYTDGSRVPSKFRLGPDRRSRIGRSATSPVSRMLPSRPGR